MRKTFIVFTTFITTMIAMNNIVYGNYVNHSIQIKGLVKQADKQTTQQAIIDAYRNLYSGFNRKDVNQMFRDYDSVYALFLLNGGTALKENIRQNLLDFFRTTRRVKTNAKINNFQIADGGLVIVVVDEYVTGITFNLQKPQVQAPFSSETQFKDIWRSTPWGWKRVQTHILQEKVVGGLQNPRPQQGQRRIQTQVTCTAPYLRYNVCNYAVNTNCIILQGTYAPPCQY